MRLPIVGVERCAPIVEYSLELLLKGISDGNDANRRDRKRIEDHPQVWGLSRMNAVSPTRRGPTCKE